ncbi:MAG: sensor histidine kinase [Anaerolineales bacterium]|jgi:two-component system sensor histidine kinase DegS
MTEADTSEALSPLDAFLEVTHELLDKVKRELQEISMLVEQSQGEVEKLAARNADVTARLHQMQAHFDTVPREDIRSGYEAALDAQQRLFTMRGQLEKLESDKKHLNEMERYIQDALKLLEGRPVIEVEEEQRTSSEFLEQVIQAQEDERRRISRQIHDGPAQVLSNFILQTEIATRLFENDPDQARAELENLKEAATTSFTKVRDYIFELRPMMLDDLGLVPTVRRYTEALREKTGLEITLLNTGVERRLESHQEVVIFRAIQELLANVRDHAQATQVKVMIDIDESTVRAAVEDNGRGFDPEMLEGEEADKLSLNQLDDKIERLGGEMDVDTKPGEGTRITITLHSTPEPAS